MQSFYCEVWFHIAGYADSLKSFAKFWWSCPYLVRSDMTRSSTFWNSMIRNFCEIRGIDFSELISRSDLRESGIFVLRSLHCARRCSRSGCYKLYSEWENGALQCMYHPGKLKATGYLSCCRGKGFSSAGCKAAFHDGSVFSLIHMRRDAEKVSEHSIPLQSELQNLHVNVEPASTTLPLLSLSAKSSLPFTNFTSGSSKTIALPKIVS